MKYNGIRSWLSWYLPYLHPKTLERKPLLISSLSSIDSLVPDVVRWINVLPRYLYNLQKMYENVTGMINQRKIDLVLWTTVKQGFLTSPHRCRGGACLRHVAFIAAPDTSRMLDIWQSGRYRKNGKVHVIHIERTYLSWSIHLAPIHLFGGSKMQFHKANRTEPDPSMQKVESRGECNLKT